MGDRVGGLSGWRNGEAGAVWWRRGGGMLSLKANKRVSK